LAEATTPRLKEHLEAAIAGHEQIAAEVESRARGELRRYRRLARRPLGFLAEQRGLLSKFGKLIAAG
jgi:hypothetical protein